MTTYPYYSQWDGDAGSAENCGPACVAMALAGLGLRPAGLTDPQWVQRVRDAAGGGTAATSCAQLMTAAKTLGAQAALLAYNASPDVPMAAACVNLNNGCAIVALVNAKDLGRSYDGHYVLVLGSFADAPVRVNDPDNQGGGNVRGGAGIAWPMGMLRRAVADAPVGPDGVIIWK
jgi:hypothetical protein